MLGAMYTKMMRRLLAPETRAALTKACSLMTSTCERITRPVSRQSRMAMAMTTFQMLGSKKAAMTIMKGMKGMPKATSAARMRTESTQPP